MLFACVALTVILGKQVLDYLDGLKWDGKARVDTWLITYFGAADEPLHRAFGRKVLVAAVRRMRKPGEKFDQMLVLESEKQGAGKSTALMIMASADFVSDAPILGLPPQRVQELLRGKWIYEIAELENLSRSDSASIKAFLSRTHDRGRPAYAHASEDIGRTCILVGTCNRDDYLKDATGNRRFWPVRCADKVDLDGLIRDRDQLWAEACAIEATGETLELDRTLWGEAAKAQDARFDIHPWEDELRDLPLWTNVVGQHWRENGEVRVSSSWIMKDVLMFNPAQMKGPDSHYVKDIMQRLGRGRPKVINIGGKDVRGVRVERVDMLMQHFGGYIGYIKRAVPQIPKRIPRTCACIYSSDVAIQCRQWVSGYISATGYITHM